MGALHLIPDPDRLRESLALAEEFGARFEYNDFFDPALLDDGAARRERIALYRSLGRDCGGDTLHGAFFDVTVHSDDPQIRRISQERVRQSMEAAAALGVRGVVFHTGTIPNFTDAFYTDGWLRRNAAFWRSVSEEFPQQEILLENMFDMRCDLLLALAEELRELPRFGVCLDYAHAAVFGGAGGAPEDWVSKLRPHIRHLHINDNDGRSDLHEAVGGGVTDWAVYDRAVRALENAPSVLVEVRSLEKQRSSLEYMKARRFYPFD